MQTMPPSIVENNANISEHVNPGSTLTLNETNQENVKNISDRDHNIDIFVFFYEKNRLINTFFQNTIEMSTPSANINTIPALPDNSNQINSIPNQNKRNSLNNEEILAYIDQSLKSLIGTNLNNNSNINNSAISNINTIPSTFLQSVNCMTLFCSK